MDEQVYKILVTTTFSEPGSNVFAMNTTVLEFAYARDAENAYERIICGYPKNAVYATAVKLY